MTIKVTCFLRIDRILNQLFVTVFINGMDKENADYFGTVDALKALYPTKIAPLQIPLMREGKMQGYVSVLSGNAYEFSSAGRQKIEIPAELASSLEEIVAALAEVAAEGEDALMEKFFEDGTLSREDIIRGVRLGIEKRSAIPVIAGSALANRGVFKAGLDTAVAELPGVFVGGDCQTAPSTAIRAIAAGKVAARNIDAYL